MDPFWSYVFLLSRYGRHPRFGFYLPDRFGHFPGSGQFPFNTRVIYSGNTDPVVPRVIDAGGAKKGTRNDRGTFPGQRVGIAPMELPVTGQGLGIVPMEFPVTGNTDGNGRFHHICQTEKETLNFTEWVHIKKLVFKGDFLLFLSDANDRNLLL